MILNKNYNLNDVITFIKESYPVKSNYLSKDQYCFINPQSNSFGTWIVVTQEKSKKLVISCVNTAEDQMTSRILVMQALTALGFRIKG